MNHHLPALVLAALPAVPVAQGAAADEVTVQWRKKAVAPAVVGAELGPIPRTAIESWAPFAREHHYRMFLTDEGRVLLLVPEKNRTARKELALIEKTCNYVDAILPAPADPEPAPAPKPREDEDEDGEPAWEEAWSWGAGEWRRDAETVVLVQARDGREYGAAIKRLAETFDYLKDWVDAAKQYAGATLERPLAAIWLLEHEDLKEWNPENELVHRLATLLVLRRFDRQPPWLLQGLAWHVEHELLRSHSCFPWRNDFVFATEHTAWESMLKEFHADTAELRIEDVVGMSRGSFQLEHARNAWGAATFLVRHHGDALPGLFEDLRELEAEKGVIRHDDGSWQRIPGYEPAPADQLTLLRKAAGDDALAELLAFYRRGKGYKPPKRSSG